MTRQEAIETLRANYPDKCYESLRNAVDIAIESIKADPRWIPVTERLPNCNGCYLVWRPHFFGGEIGMPAICYFDGSNTWHDSYGVDFERTLHPDDVTAWMPLPKPYREVTEEEYKRMLQKKVDGLMTWTW